MLIAKLPLSPITWSNFLQFLKFLLFYNRVIVSRIFQLDSTNFDMSTQKRKSAGDGNAKRKQRKSTKEEDESGDSEFDDVSPENNDEFKDSNKDDIDDLLGEDSGLVFISWLLLGNILSCSGLKKNGIWLSQFFLLSFKNGGKVDICFSFASLGSLIRPRNRKMDEQQPLQLVNRLKLP